MEVIEKNKLGERGWIPTNRTRLNMEGRDNVFVLGDTTNLPISKAGSTAHFEADTLGENIAAMVKMGLRCATTTARSFASSKRARTAQPTRCSITRTPPDPKAPTRAVHWFKMAYNKLYWASARGLL